MAGKPFAHGDLGRYEDGNEMTPPKPTSTYRYTGLHGRGIQWDGVRVDQMASHTGLTMNPPTIQSGSYHGLTPDGAEAFAAALMAAAAQAREWDKDTGKDAKEVLENAAQA